MVTAAEAERQNVIVGHTTVDSAIANLQHNIIYQCGEANIPASINCTIFRRQPAKL